MKMRAWRLPWSGEWVPHALLDILRGCNLSCPACYNAPGTHIKSMEQVREEFEFLARSRRLDSLGIVGGEPLMHPHIDEIVRMINSSGISVELFTNGLLLDDQRLTSLKRAGLDALMLHIDAHQDRADLPQVSDAALQKLWTDKARQATAAGLEAGLAITAYPEALERIEQAIEFVLNSSDVDFLLVTLCRDVQSMGTLRGDLFTGIWGQPPAAERSGNTISSVCVLQRMEQRFGLTPFAYVGSNVSDDDPRWLSYVVATAIKPNAPAARAILQASATERLFLGLFRRIHGRYPFYFKQSPAKLRLQLLLNALTGGRFGSNLALLGRSLGRGRLLKTKRILFQCPAELASDGKLIHCSNCPDATVRHGRLMPVCISDQVVGDAV